MESRAILRPEMWKYVIDHLTSLDDLLTAYNTCQMWRSLLSGNRMEWMFQGIFPSLVKYLPKSDILNSRQVCKSWTKAVNSYLENDQPSLTALGRPSNRIWRHPPPNLLVDLNKSAEKFNLSITETLQRFQTEFGSDEMSTGKNPFVSPSLTLSISELNVGVLNFFETFGVHLRSLHFSVLQEEEWEISSPLEIAQFIWNILGHVPNVKHLVLMIFQSLEIVFEMDINQDEKEAQRVEVEQFFQTNSAPRLPQLNNLTIDGNVHMINEVVTTAYLQQLNKYVYVSPQDYVPTSLTNVTELGLRFVRGHSEDELNNIRNLECPSVHRLEIFLFNCQPRERDDSPIDQLFGTIETFKSSLTHLYIFWALLKSNFPAQLDLPFVQQLTLEISSSRTHKYINLSFLQSLRSLRKLKLIIWKSCYARLLRIRRPWRQSTEETVDLHYYLHRRWLRGPYQSNIWRLLPSLQEIEIQVVGKYNPATVTKTTVYTRYNKNKNRVWNCLSVLCSFLEFNCF